MTDQKDIISPIDVAIVILCHNYGRYLGEALESVLSQTVLPGDILVVDDGSTDNTRSVVERYGQTVRYLYLNHVGVCAARNAGLREARGKWLIFLDADDELMPDYIEKTLGAFEQSADPKPTFIYTQRQDLETGMLNSHFPEYDVALLKMKNFVLISALIDREKSLQIGFDPAFAEGLEDYDFFLSLAEQDAVGLLVDEPLLRVRSHGLSRSRHCGIPAVRWNLLGELLEKHAALYNEIERQKLLQQRREYVWRATAVLRRTARPFHARVQDLIYLAKAGGGGRRLLVQLLFTCVPSLFIGQAKNKESV